MTTKHRIFAIFVFCFVLVVAAAPLGAEVKAYEKKINIPTWQTGESEVHSVFWDSGRDIYPYTLDETLTNNKVDQEYTGVFLENEYVKILVLPEIGGRLHGALDKTNQYVWLYWQKTIKPGLVGMTGAWISGGIEWNFPHGHRPSGFMPVDHRIVHNADGSATVWVGETEPMFRMRWLVGMTLYPGKSYLRCDYVFINPTSNKHSFMFWATSATHANEWSQAQYPGDVVTGHGKHQFWNWPIHNGVDLTWWKNVPNASSFFAFNNPSEWFGTYDHKAQGGMLHLANVHIMPGKKLWTWGSGPSGRIWDDILSDGGGPYFEPQAGAWSDNQPDYHWIQPYEVKRAHDYWYPVRDTRGFKAANRDFAINTDVEDGVAFAGVYATGTAKDHRIVLKDTRSGDVLHDQTATIAPDSPFTVEAKAASGVTVYDLHLEVYDADGDLAIDLQQQRPKKIDLPEGHKDPGDPKKMNTDELYHAGEYLDRFRETSKALEYYEELLRRDEFDSRGNVEMGFLALKEGKWENALAHFDKALLRDSDNARIYYGKGLALKGLGQFDEAYKTFYRATYNYDYFSAAYFNLALLDMRNGDHEAAIAKLDEAATHNGRFADLHAMKAAALRLSGSYQEALKAADRALEEDPMHFMGGRERLLSLKGSGEAAGEWSKTWAGYMRDADQNYIELATAYGSAGMFADADSVLAKYSDGKPEDAVNPMVNYFRAYYCEQAGNESSAGKYLARAVRGPVLRVNPHRLEAVAALEAAIKANPRDAHAHLFLGNLQYAMKQREEGFAHWRKATELDANLAPAWRNFAYGLRNFKKDLEAAHDSYQKALQLAPKDPRILLEYDELAEERGADPVKRLAMLEDRMDVVDDRDDLVQRVIDLRLEVGDNEQLMATYEILRDHHFHVWEGKYGIHHAWVEVNQRLGDQAMEAGDLELALKHYQEANDYPANLEVAPRTPDFRAHVNWNLARVYEAMGKTDVAREYLQKVVDEKYGKQHLGTYYQALSYKKLGNQAQYDALLEKLEQQARQRTSGEYRYRGTPKTIGHYLLALVLEERGESNAAEQQLQQAKAANPHAGRLAIREAQLDIAGAHQ